MLVTAKAEGDDACRIEPMMIEQWMSEVRDAELRRTVLRLRRAVIDADGYVIESESMWMLTAIEHWGIRPGGLEALIHCSARSTSYCPGAGVSRFPIDRIMLACEGESV